MILEQICHFYFKISSEIKKQSQQKQSKPIVVIQILPNYFIYDIKLEDILFFYTGFTFLLQVFILTIVFIASIKKETTLDGHEVTHFPRKCVFDHKSPLCFTPLGLSRLCAGL